MARVVMRLIAVLCLACIAGSAPAQDPRTIAVQTAARAWLAVVDRGDAHAAWDAGGKKFRSTLSAAQWTDALAKERKLNGPVTRRTVGPTRFHTSLPGMPDGEYAQILFRTSFANKPNGRESVTLEREADGAWRVIGYFPRTS
jgi:uncharacterized protein DUF4019